MQQYLKAEGKVMLSHLPAELLCMFELKPLHATAPEHQSPKLLIVFRMESHLPFIPAQAEEAVQVEEPCTRHFIL